MEKEGIQALTLRAAARAAGVSHAAPKNHFGDLTGLLSELAALGFVRFGAALADAMAEAGDDPRQPDQSDGSRLCRLCRRPSGLFALMFRSEALDHDRPALRDAVLNARQALCRRRPCPYARQNDGAAADGRTGDSALVTGALASPCCCWRDA